METVLIALVGARAVASTTDAKIEVVMSGGVRITRSEFVGEVSLNGISFRV